ncbi:MAG: GHMP kinase [Chloroflexota bacterium]
MAISKKLKTIKATAPIRICDNGGWTDTWFAEYGTVFNIAVSPLVHVEIACFPRSEKPCPVTIIAQNYGDEYGPKLDGASWEKHPLIEATLVHSGIPNDVAIELHIFSEAPAGASTGTSAALTIALLAGLAELNGQSLDGYALASAAHHVETVLLKQQSGIQDQLCAAFGGINLIEMAAYPHATVTQLHLSETVTQELEDRLLLIYLGQPHSSSAIHEKVIRELEDLGRTAKQLAPLRETAVQAATALQNGDFQALGQSMIANHEAQRGLNTALISPEADQIAAMAQQYGALGWKVNGAGGNGGSITLLGNQNPEQKQQLIQAIEAADPNFKNLSIRLQTKGVTVQTD